LDRIRVPLPGKRFRRHMEAAGNAIRVASRQRERDRTADRPRALRPRLLSAFCPNWLNSRVERHSGGRTQRRLLSAATCGLSHRCARFRQDTLLSDNSRAESLISGAFCKWVTRLPHFIFRVQSAT
jgi:hypothetical protein